MKMLCLLVILLLPCLLWAAADHIVIYEILYNPAVTEPSGEWIELYNPTGVGICIDGLSVDDGNTDGDEGTWVIPDPTSADDYILCPGGYVTLANDADTFFVVYGKDPDFAANVGARADVIALETTGSLYMNNTSDQVYLRDAEWNIIDCVQWGTTYETGSDSIFYPLGSAEGDGESILRVPSSDEGAEVSGEVSESLSVVWYLADDVAVDYEGPNTGGLVGVPVIKGTQYAPLAPTSQDTVEVSCYVVDDEEVDTVFLHYSIDGAPYDSVGMTNVSDSTYIAHIMPQPTNTSVMFYITAYDISGYMTRDPSGTDAYSYVVSDDARILVYFNKDVDNTFATIEYAQGNVPLDIKLCEYISAAQYTIDMCVYDFDRQIVCDSLIAAHNRGVEIRVIIDGDNWSTQAYALQDAGIPVICDTFPVGYSGSNLMHNKFILFDVRDSTTLADDIVWTGSYNVTDNGTDLNAQNVIVIKDPNVGAAFLAEFNEMWGSDSMVPDADNSKFSTSKTDNSDHWFWVGDVQVECFFSPTEDAMDTIAQYVVSTADTSVDFCIFSFTYQAICDSMKNHWNGESGEYCNVRGVFDATFWTGSPYSKARDMAGFADAPNPWSPPLDTLQKIITKDNVDGNLLHSKYMIIDAFKTDSDPIVVTGSANWSNNSNNYNDENIVIIHSSRVANLYYQDFAARMQEAGGALQPAPTVVSQTALSAFPVEEGIKLVWRAEGDWKLWTVERNGVVVAEVPPSLDGKNSFLDRDVSIGRHSYVVHGKNGLGRDVSLGPVCCVYPGAQKPSIAVASVVPGNFDVYCTLPYSVEGELVMYDVAGRKVWSAPVDDKVIVDVSYLPSGVYFLMLSWEGGEVSEKVVLVR